LFEDARAGWVVTLARDQNEGRQRRMPTVSSLWELPAAHTAAPGRSFREPHGARSALPMQGAPVSMARPLARRTFSGTE